MNYKVFKIKEKIKGATFSSIMYITKPIRTYTSTDACKKRRIHKDNVRSVKKCVKRVYKAFSSGGYDELYITDYRDFENELMMAGWDGFYFLEEEEYKKVLVKKLTASKFNLTFMNLDEYRKDFVKTYGSDLSETQLWEFENKQIYRNNLIFIKIILDL